MSGVILEHYTCAYSCVYNVCACVYVCMCMCACDIIYIVREFQRGYIYLVSLGGSPLGLSKHVYICNVNTHCMHGAHESSVT